MPHTTTTIRCRRLLQLLLQRWQPRRQSLQRLLPLLLQLQQHEGAVVVLRHAGEGAGGPTGGVVEQQQGEGGHG
jgi:hypothetical protein